MRFESALSDATRRLEQPSLQAAHVALDELSEALSLWRGDPFQDVAYEPFVDAEVQRLQELRATALEQTIEDASPLATTTAPCRSSGSSSPTYPAP